MGAQLDNIAVREPGLYPYILGRSINVEVGLASGPGYEMRKAPPRTVSIGSARVQRFPEKRQELLLY